MADNVIKKFKITTSRGRKNNYINWNEKEKWKAGISFYYVCSCNKTSVKCQWISFPSIEFQHSSRN